MRISVVLVDNGEPLLEESVRSLRDQTERVSEVIICPGPRTDLELAKSLADKVVEAEPVIGRARVRGVLNASGDVILSCDADTIYSPNYAELMALALRDSHAALATPRSLNRDDPLALLEESVAAVTPIPYEYALAFRRQSFLNAGIHLKPYRVPRDDIGWHVLFTLLPRRSPATCYTRMPTKGAWWLFALSMGLAPVAAVSLAPLSPLLREQFSLLTRELKNLTTLKV